MRKKIIVIHPIDDGYGATRILAKSIFVLSERFDIEIWTQKDNGYLVSLLKELNCTVPLIVNTHIPIVHSKMLNFHELFRTIKNVICFSFDVFHSGKNDKIFYVNTYAGALALFPLKILGKKSVVHCHEAQDQKILGRLLSKFVLFSSNKIICVSNRVEKYASMGKPQSKTKVIWNGIEDYVTEDIGPSPFPNDKFNIVLVGRVTVEKGYWFLADSLSLLPKEIRSKIIVHCIGDSPPNRLNNLIEFKNYLKINNLTKTIICYGYKPNAQFYMSYADLILIPSVMVDPFPTTVLEAMRLGKALITTNHGGAVEIVESGYNGFLCSPNDTATMSSLIEYVYYNRDIAENVGFNARKTYENKLTIDIYSQKLIELLSDI